MPAICWLKMTDYMQGWMQDELGGSLVVKEQRVVSAQHIDGARDVFRMETDEGLPCRQSPGNAISAAWRNALDAGLAVDARTIKQEYGITGDILKQYIPVECPKMAMTSSGVLRPWTLDTAFGQKQATALQRILREAFWQAVDEYARKYATEHLGQRYAQSDMIESFCISTGTPDIHIESIRREWQRRIKSKKKKYN